MAETVALRNKFYTVETLVSEVQIPDGASAGQLRALAANPVTLIPAPGANKAILVEKVELVFDVTTTGYTETDDDILIEYGDGTDLVTFDATGFLDQTTDQVRWIVPQPWGKRSMGVVTQITSKATGVTLNASHGTVTMHNANLLTVTAVSFTVTNSFVALGDAVTVSIQSAATAGAYTLTVDAVAAGSFQLSLRNHTLGTLAEAVVINFEVHSAKPFTPPANSTVRIANNSGEWTGGNAANTLSVRTEYQIVPTVAFGS